MEKESIIQKKSFEFSLAVIKVYQIHLSQKEFVLSKQLLKSATSIGANIEEARGGISKKDFIAKMYISLKEAKETKYWLLLLERSQMVNYSYLELLSEIEQIIKILTSIVKTSQERLRAETKNSKL